MKSSIGSLLLVFLYFIVVMLLGRAFLSLTLKERGFRHTAIEMGVAGNLVFGALYILLQWCRGRELLLPLCSILSVISLFVPWERSFKMRPLPVKVACSSVLLVIACWFAYFADRLPLGSEAPVGFSWIDTPLWLSLAYGIERGMPVPDLLFKGAVVNYHYRAEVFLALFRSFTGLPMHVAYYAVLAISCFSISLLFPLLVQEYLRFSKQERDWLLFVVPLVAVV